MREKFTLNFKTICIFFTYAVAGLICTGSVAEDRFRIAYVIETKRFIAKKEMTRAKCDTQEQQCYKATIAKLTQTIAKNHRDVEALYQRAIAYMNLNTIAESDANWTQAEDDLSQVIALDPSHAEAYLKRGKIRGGQEGRQDLDRAIALQPNYAEAYASRGVMRNSDDDDAQGALEDLNRAIALAPTNAWTYLQRASVRERLGDYSGAATDRQKAVQVEPTAETYRLRAGFSAGTQERIADYSEAIRLNPNDSWSYHFRAQSYEDAKNYDAALADIQQLRLIKQSFPDNMHPDVPGTYAWQARLKRQMGDLKGAIADYTTAIALQPKNINFYRNRAMLRQQIGDHFGAEQDRQTVAGLPSEIGIVEVIDGDRP